MNGFCRWCRRQGVRDLQDVSPFVVAAYIEQLTWTQSAPTVKQALAAIRMLFDFLVIASAIFMALKVINKLKTPPPPAADPAPAPDVVLLTEIRDLLKHQR